MSNKIRTYHDLVEEEKRLSELLKAQKEVLTYDVKILKQQLRPGIVAMNTMGKLFSKDHSNGVLGIGIDTLIDVFVRKGFLNKAGWFTKFIIPFFLKNASSHVMSDARNKWFKKAFSWFKRGNHKKDSTPNPEATPHRHKPGTNGKEK